MAPRTSKIVAYGFARAASRCVNLALAGTTMYLAAALESWAFFGASGAVYLAMMGRDLLRRDFWEKTRADLQGRRAALPDPSSLTGGRARRLIERMGRARAERTQLMGSPAARKIPQALAARLDCVLELEELTVADIQKLDELDAYVESKNPSTVRQESERLLLAAQNATDTRVRAQYQIAGITAAETLQAVDDVMMAREILAGRVEHMVVLLEFVPCDIARLMATDALAEPTALRALLEAIRGVTDAAHGVRVALDGTDAPDRLPACAHRS